LDTNIVIIGAGVIGLAIAKELSSSFDDIYLIEKNSTFGQETSSRNSEVIHSGIYYPTGSLKATLCVEGKKLLYKYCEEKQIPHKKIGKLVVATNDEEKNILKNILKQSQMNGVTDSTYLTEKETKAIEPNVYATAALFFPTTGIIDSHYLMKQLETDAIKQGTNTVYKTEVTNISKKHNCYEITVKDDCGKYSFSTNIVINATGLYSDKISEIAGISDEYYNLHYWKGEYFSVGNGKNKYIKHLIYPVPNNNLTGVGIHATLDMANRLKLGPNAIYLPEKKINYNVNILHKELFYRSVKTFLPFIELADLQPEQAGIRPKLQKPNDVFRDFIIKNETDKGFHNFINLIGIESPGLTCCLAIAKKVKEMII
jgi:L-2-hydroxyglutarate oxidase LhgO